MKIPVCQSTDLLPGKSVSLTVGDIRVAVFRLATGTVHAVEDRCPHRGARLSEGLLYDEFIACLDHGWSVCVLDGRVCAPERGQVKVFPVSEEDGGISLEVD